jgi:hypothetical protein
VSRAFAIAFVVLVAVPAWADDDDDKPEEVMMRFREHDGNLTMSGTLPKLFDNAAYDALDSGVASVVDIRLAIFQQGSQKPMLFSTIELRAVYEPWDEVFYIDLNNRLTGKKKYKEKRKAEALKRLSVLDDLVIAKLDWVPYDQSFVVAMYVQLNPIDDKTLAEVRRWLTQGGGLDRGGAFFGSFVSLFVNPKIADADRTLRIQSQPFIRKKPAK